MKTGKLSLGIAAFALAAVLAISTSPSARANKYWRFNPQTGVQIDPSDCTPDAPLCANIYNDAGTQMVGTLDGDYNP